MVPVFHVDSEAAPTVVNDSIAASGGTPEAALVIRNGQRSQL